MLYEHTSHKILEILKMIPFVTEEQLYMLFENECSPEQMAEVIDELELQKRIIRQIQYGTIEVITVPRPIRYSKDAVTELIEAFWLVCNMGIENVRYISQGDGPTKYCVIAENFVTTDITVCPNETVAELGARIRRQNLVNDANDDVSHIAYVYTEEKGLAMRERLRSLGYDYYSFLDPKTHEAQYIDVEEG